MKTKENYEDLFTKEVLEKLLPAERADQFFEALYGDAAEGAFNISLEFSQYESERNLLFFEFHLKERPGKCLACNLTYGLPDVFTRHPLINVKGIVQGIEKLLDGRHKCNEWSLGHTRPDGQDIHAIPLTITLD